MRGGSRPLQSTVATCAWLLIKLVAYQCEHWKFEQNDNYVQDE